MKLGDHKSCNYNKVYIIIIKCKLKAPENALNVPKINQLNLLICIILPFIYNLKYKLSGEGNISK